MMLACRFIDETQLSHLSASNMAYFRMRLRLYRLHALDHKKNKSGYKSDIKKGTPIILVKKFAAFERKIKNIPLFENDIRVEYLTGLQLIYSKYYEAMAGHNYRKLKGSQNRLNIDHHRTYYDKEGNILPGFLPLEMY
jgi:hypothetical protein